MRCVAGGRTGAILPLVLSEGLARALRWGGKCPDPTNGRPTAQWREM